MADGHDACVGELRAELVEEAEHALQTLLMVVNRLFELMLLAVVLVLVMTVNRLADRSTRPEAIPSPVSRSTS